jgi:hypothetical protein
MKKFIVLSLVFILVTLLCSNFAIAQKALILVGDTYVEPEAGLVKVTIATKGFDSDIVKINSDPNNRGWADATDPTTIDFSKYALAYFTWNAPGHDLAYFMKGTEQAFRKWVENGGIVWLDAFDDNFIDENGNQAGLWFPIDQYPAKVINTADSDVEVTQAGKDIELFSYPNVVDLTALTLDDNFTEMAPEYVVLATRTDGNGAAAFQLKYGKGYYVGMCIDTRDAARLAAAAPLIQNALVYATKLLLLSASPVTSQKSLSVTWSEIKK